jgi:hypothetical protein
VSIRPIFKVKYMSQAHNSAIDLSLNPLGDPATIHKTPHGILRTILHPHQSEQTVAFLATRYDDQRLVLVLALGKQSAALTGKMIDWLWEKFPADEVDAKGFSEQLYDYLQDEARSIGDETNAYSLVIGALTRAVPEGRLWLAWLGTAGVRALKGNREPLQLEQGLIPGEGWSPKNGVVPEHARPHTKIVPLNTVDRLLIFSNALQPVADELAYLGRAATQRVAEAHADKLPSVLFDLQPFRVVPEPEAFTVRYRWDTPYEVTLFWSASLNATGYRLEQASSPTFDDAVMLAEMTDERQRLYRVQPPTNEEVYYRVVPLAENLPGKASVPIVVTPIQLIPPIIESVQWMGNGGFKLTWANLPQADSYDLECSPEDDFDSPETTIIYQGGETSFETDADFATGWYFRVRSANTYFAPKSPSQWSVGRRAPVFLDVPQFEQISSSKIIWGAVDGASVYEVRHRKESEDEGSGYESHGFVEERSFTPPQRPPTLYQVRALRSEQDLSTASPWSKGIVISVVDGQSISAAVIERNSSADADTTPEFLMEDTDTAPLVRPKLTQTRQTQRWQMVLIAAAVALGIGLIAGLIGGPRLGIGVDSSLTPIPQSDIDRTATQNYIFVDNSTQRAVLTDEVGRAQALATENANTISNQMDLNEILSEDLADQQATVSMNMTQIADLEASQATVENDLSIVRQEATNAADENSVLVTTIESMETAVTDYDNEIATLQNDLDDNIETLNDLRATATAQSRTLTALQDESDNQAATIQSQAATATALQNQVNDFESTATAAAPTPTPTVTPTVDLRFPFSR